jgi:toxin YoeB
MQIDFSDKAKADLDFWIKSGNKGILNKIYSLIEDI